VVDQALRAGAARPCSRRGVWFLLSRPRRCRRPSSRGRSGRPLSSGSCRPAPAERIGPVPCRRSFRERSDRSVAPTTGPSPVEVEEPERSRGVSGAPKVPAAPSHEVASVSGRAPAVAQAARANWIFSACPCGRSVGGRRVARRCSLLPVKSPSLRTCRGEIVAGDAIACLGAFGMRKATSS